MDFSNTAKLSGITVENLSGNVLTGYTVKSQSGCILFAATGLVFCLIRRAGRTR